VEIMADWLLILAYMKFFAGLIIGVLAYMSDLQYRELLILIAGLVVLSSGITIQFKQNSAKRNLEKRKS
jgi:hypothetical protein